MVARLLSNVLKNGLLAYGIIYLFNHIFLGRFNYWFAAMIWISYFSSLLIENFLLKHQLGYKHIALANTFLWMNIVGEIFYYGVSTYYDKVLHFIIPFFITYIMIIYFKKNLKIDYLLTFLSVMGCLVIFEIYEYLVTMFIGYEMLGVIINGVVIMSYVDDTFADLLVGMTATFLMIVIHKSLNKNRRKKKNV